MSIFFSTTTVLVGQFLSFNLKSIFLFSGGLAFLDFIRAKILTGFPWNLWAYSYSWIPEILQSLNKLGLFAFNLIAITLFMIPAVIFFRISNIKKFLILSLISIIFLFSFIYGETTINKNQKILTSINTKFNIKVISPNFELEYGLSKDQIIKRYEKLIRYSEPKKNLKTLFVWPEGAFSGYSYDELTILKEKFIKNFSDKHYILFGVNRADEKKQGFYNSLIIVNNQFEIIKEYKKQKLVPFGEFLPLENLLNKFGLK